MLAAVELEVVVQELLVAAQAAAATAHKTPQQVLPELQILAAAVAAAELLETAAQVAPVLLS